MILAMGIGMAIFTVLFRVLLTSTGYLALRTETPFLWFAGMAVFMTVPMVALMRYYQAHSWRQCAEMTGAMLVPPGTVAALVQFGVIAYPWLAVSTLPASTHVTMLLGMIESLRCRVSPMGVPRPTRVRSSCSSRDSIARSSSRPRGRRTVYHWGLRRGTA
jgi:hypothetical protein